MKPHFGSQNCSKMVPKWPQDSHKMTPRWPQDGLLEGLGAQDGAKRLRRSKKTIFCSFLVPCWGPSWEPNFDIFITRMVQKRLQNPVGLHVVSRHQFLSENGPLGTPSGHEKSSKSIGGLSKFKVFGFPLKVALGSHLGEAFGTILGPKLRPSWAMLGIKLA